MDTSNKSIKMFLKPKVITKGPQTKQENLSQ